MTAVNQNQSIFEINKCSNKNVCTQHSMNGFNFSVSNTFFDEKLLIYDKQLYENASINGICVEYGLRLHEIILILFCIFFHFFIMLIMKTSEINK